MPPKHVIVGWVKVAGRRPWMVMS